LRLGNKSVKLSDGFAYTPAVLVQTRGLGALMIHGAVLKLAFFILLL